MTMENRRRHKRFCATAFLNMPVLLSQLPPFFGVPIKGKLIDLSAGGLALLIREIIPKDTLLFMAARFPDGSLISCTASVCHVIPKGDKYMHGMEFLDLGDDVKKRIDDMSNHYIDCETKIAQGDASPCNTACAFYSMCTKNQKLVTSDDPQAALELAFRRLDEAPVVS